MGFNERMPSRGVPSEGSAVRIRPCRAGCEVAGHNCSFERQKHLSRSHPTRERLLVRPLRELHGFREGCRNYQLAIASVLGPPQSAAMPAAGVLISTTMVRRGRRAGFEISE